MRHSHLGFVMAFVASAAWTACGDEEVACPDVACIRGAQIEGPLVASFAEARDLLVEVCRNEVCFSGSLGPDADEPLVGNGVGFSLPDRPERRDELQSARVDITFLRKSDGTVRLQARWTPWSEAELRDGDRYRVNVTTPSGEQLLSFDQTVTTYPINQLGTGACTQRCKLAKLSWDEGEL